MPKMEKESNILGAIARGTTDGLHLALNVGVDFILFDGEEYVFDGSGPQPRDKYFFGSEHFATQYRKSPPRHRYAAGVLLDLCAGKDAKFPIEQHSWQMAQPVVNDVWRTAMELQVASFQNQMSKTAVWVFHK